MNPVSVFAGIWAAGTSGLAAASADWPVNRESCLEPRAGLSHGFGPYCLRFRRCRASCLCVWVSCPRQRAPGGPGGGARWGRGETGRGIPAAVGRGTPLCFLRTGHAVPGAPGLPPVRLACHLCHCDSAGGRQPHSATVTARTTRRFLPPPGPPAHMAAYIDVVPADYPSCLLWFRSLPVWFLAGLASSCATTLPTGSPARGGADRGGGYAAEVMASKSVI
jgi:hypothetical protein